MASNAYLQGEEPTLGGQHIPPCDNRNTSDSEKIPSTKSVTKYRIAEKYSEPDRGELPSQNDNEVIETLGNSESQSRLVIHELSWFCMNLLFPFTSIVLFFVDVVSDILLAREYYNEDIMWEFGLTAFFVIVPSIIIFIFGLEIYIENFWKYPLVVRITCLIMTFLMMSPVISQLEYIYYRIKYRNKSSSEESEDENRSKVIHDKYYDACYLSMIECFLEAAPQLKIQVYILIKHRDDETLLTEVIRAVAIFSSWVCMSWSLVATEKSYCLTNGQNMSIPGIAFYFLWRATEIGTRIIAIGLFAAQFSYYVAIVIGVHWLVMFLLGSYCKRTSLRQDTCMELQFILVHSCRMAFCLTTYFDKRSRLFYYIVVYIENCLMISLWFHFNDDKGVWFHIPALLIVVLGFFVQLIFQLTYHRWFHRKSPIKSLSYVPCREHCFIRCLCHDRNDS